MNSTQDIYDRVTAKIIADLEQGVRPWRKPWSAGELAGRVALPLRQTGAPYRGINTLLLWAAAVEAGYQSPTWMTLKQANRLGGKVRKGERGAQIVYFDRLTRTETGADGAEAEITVPFAKAYTVFNTEQIEGLAPERRLPAAAQDPDFAPNEAAERFFDALGAEISHGGGRAYYAEGPDQIRLPPKASFEDAEGYYATLAHEIVHWTKHKSRLGRDLGRKRWGDQGYAAEELVAELGAAFLCAELGVSPEPREAHASYIESWLEALKSDKRFIFRAASLAQKAVDYLRAQQPETAAEQAA